MRYPNLRYGNPNELRHYAQFIPLKDLARRLRRSERTVRDWLSEREKLPWWVPEIIRFQNMEHAERVRQMGMQPVRLRLGLVTGSVIAFPSRSELLSRDQQLHQGFQLGDSLLLPDSVADERNQVSA